MMVTRKLEFDLTENGIKEAHLISNDPENPFDLAAPIATDTLNRRVLSLSKNQFNWIRLDSVSLVLTSDKGEVFKAGSETLNQLLLPAAIPLPPPHSPPQLEFGLPNRGDLLPPIPDPKSPLGIDVNLPLNLEN